MSFSIIPVAMAATSGAGSISSNFSSFFLLSIFVVAFYFLLLRPQNKRAKEHKDLVTNLAKGDEVLTSGGLLGKVMKVRDDFVMLTIADSVEVKVQKASISTSLPKGTIKSV